MPTRSDAPARLDRTWVVSAMTVDTRVGIGCVVQTSGVAGVCVVRCLAGPVSVGDLFYTAILMDATQVLVRLRIRRMWQCGRVVDLLNPAARRDDGADRIEGRVADCRAGASRCPAGRVARSWRGSTRAVHWLRHHVRATWPCRPALVSRSVGVRTIWLWCPSRARDPATSPGTGRHQAASRLEHLLEFPQV